MGGKVYFENHYYLHGYWGILIDRYEEMIENYHPGIYRREERETILIEKATTKREKRRVTLFPILLNQSHKNIDCAFVNRWIWLIFGQKVHNIQVFVFNGRIGKTTSVGGEIMLAQHQVIPNLFCLSDCVCLIICMALREGLEVHCVVLKNGFCVNLYVGTSLVEMFVRSLVSWTAVIVGFARCGDMSEARKLFDVMPDRDIVASNVMIDGYVKMGCMDLARDLFDKMKDKNVISWTSMVHGYCEDDDVVAARFMFDCMPVKNVLSWNAMIRGYCENRRPHDALKLFWEMRGRLDVEMNKVTVVSVLPTVADLSSLDLGVWIHGFVQRNRLDEDVHVYALVDMYAKCGEIGKAKLLFEEMNEKDTSSWNALINGYGVNGCAKEALEVFAAMLREGFEPNEITMTSVLSACNHCGLVEEGRRCFKEMERFGIVPQIEHYGCMIDLLGRVGYLDEAENLIFCVVALSVASSV